MRPCQTERGFDTLSNAKAVNHTFVRPQANHAALFAMSRQQQARRVNVRFATIGANPRAMKRKRLAGHGISDERHERGTNVPGRMLQRSVIAKVAISGRD